jgi:hypothetical protein
MALLSRTDSNTKKGSKKRWVFIGLGIAATSALSFFGIRYWKKHKQQNEISSDTSSPQFAPPKKTAAKTKTVKPKPTSTKTSTKPNSKINITETAKKIHSAVTTKNFNTVLGLLKTITSVTDYTSVSKEFAKYMVNGVKQTLVNGVLSSFKDEKQKIAIRSAFAAMGLKYDGKKWSLSGINEKTLVTNKATKVWKDPKTSVPVPENMVLGKEIAQRGSFKMFQNDNQLFLVESQHVNYYN